MDAQSEKLLAQIIRNTRIASLATLRDEAPQASMVAYITTDDFSAFHIFVSRLAQHTMDMQKNKRVSLLITETDDGRDDPQTLARVSIRGVAEFVQNGEPGYTPLKERYLARFPASEQLFKLEDFSFWRINPKGGRFVAGFGKAYNITPETLGKVSSR
jgi:heme iron utilization protein